MLQLAGLDRLLDRALVYECSETEQLQWVLSCLKVDAMPEPGILIVRGIKNSHFQDMIPQI